MKNKSIITQGGFELDYEILKIIKIHFSDLTENIILGNYNFEDTRNLVA
jgi:hypothetical protein